jgi:hypothetical protein
MRVWSNTSCLYNEINEEKHKLVHTINRSLDQESRQHKYFSCGMVHQGIEGHYVRPWSLNLFCRRGFGLVISVVVPLMLVVLPYAVGHGFDSQSRLLTSRTCQLHKTQDEPVIGANRLQENSAQRIICPRKIRPKGKFVPIKFVAKGKFQIR